MPPTNRVAPKMKGPKGAPPFMPASPDAPAEKLTGRANALTRGQGKKIGLRRITSTSTAPSVQSAPATRPAPSMPKSSSPATPTALAPKARKASKPKLTGRANALTRGRGKKVGLRRTRRPKIAMKKGAY